MFEELCEKAFGTISIILCGDFNLDIKKRKTTNFMKTKFGLKLEVNPKIPTIRYGSSIDT